MLTTQEIDALLNASREADEGPTMLVRRVEAAVEAAERERWKEAAMLTGDALRELERYEYAAATIGLRKAVASMGPNAEFTWRRRRSGATNGSASTLKQENER